MNDPATSARVLSEGERAPRIFYGWVVVGAAFAVLFVAYGIQFTFGVFMHFIAADTGWSRGNLSAPYSLYVFIYSVLGFATGRLTDRYGPRRVITIGACLLGAGVILMGRAHALWQFYLALGVLAACGMSAAYVPCNATVVRWFTRRRGLAISITASGSSLGVFAFPPLATWLITLCGWRRAYLILGAFGLVAIAAFARLILRDPERMGLLPDGAPNENAAGNETSTAPLASAEEWTLEEAKGTRAFWLLIAIFTMTWLVVFVPMVHIVPFANDLGIPEFRAAMTISVIGLAGFGGRLSAGPVSDRIGRLLTLGIFLLLQALSFVGFTLSRELLSLYAAAAFFGLSYGGVTSLFPALVGDFFGRLWVGAIIGFMFAFAGSPAAFGPLIAGYIYDFTGSYRIAFELGAFLNLAALGLVFFLQKPHRD